jgi:hypothetical protein
VESFANEKVEVATIPPPKPVSGKLNTTGKTMIFLSRKKIAVSTLEGSDFCEKTEVVKQVRVKRTIICFITKTYDERRKKDVHNTI